MAQDSWLTIPPGCHFSLENIPFGIISKGDPAAKHPAIAIGEFALDLQIFASEGGFDPLPSRKEYLSVFSQPTLNAFAAMGRKTHRIVRQYLQDVFLQDTLYPKILKENKPLREKALLPLKEIRNHMPMFIGDYTDFFAGINHAFNVGTMFRGPANALQPNYKHLPVGYHGRASSVVVSGTDIRRPRSQILQDPSAEVKVPILMPSQRLDIELELGAFLCEGNAMGDNIPINTAEDAIFGIVLMNDWSARDIQTWEYVPLGPFNAKNFGTSISAWIVLADALEPFRCAGISNDTEILPYLKEPRRDNAYDIDLEVILKSELHLLTLATGPVNI
jgi:fumarylacetoacetase